ncbi:MAG TPA: EAL domain-containing protein [Usitatibacter sp.]|nr:EAL domain-containing protein [Usitatibacter sp.]
MSGKYRPFSDYESVPRGRRLVVIVWLFAGIVVCLLVAAINSVDLLSAGRAFVGAEGQWSRAQKDAVFYLTRYAQTRDEALYDAFQHSIAVPLGTRKARLEMLKPEPDLAIVRAGFIEGRNHPADIDSMITLFQRFRHFAPVQQSMFLWERADAGVDDLIQIGHELHDASPDTEPIDLQIERINRINVTLGRLEEAIAATLGEAQRAAQSVLLAGMLSLAAVLLVAGIMVSQRFVASNEKLQETLRESEAQLRLLIEEAPMPLLVMRPANQELLYGNERALQQLALTSGSLPGRSLADFHVDPDIRAALPEALSRHGSVRDYEVHFKDLTGRQFWLLLSAQPIRYGGTVALLVALANIDDRKRMQDDMKRKAMQDPLTELPNRASFMEALEHAVRRVRRKQGRVSVLFIDLDHFKEVNDSLGHAAGDRLLLAVSERLAGAVRTSDIVARLGGDEFVVIVEDPRSPEEAMIVAKKILHGLERPVLIDFNEVAISGSIGIASYPEDGDDVETLVKNADAAMYQAKERGRNTFQHYSEDLHNVALARADIEQRVRAALENGEFYLEYQPEIDLASGERVAVEALLRWKEPITGVVMPADFLPLAEESGTIVAIGEWVLERALADLAAWREHGLNLVLSINVSGRQLQHAEFPTVFQRALKTHGIAADKVRIEIPEPALMTESDAIDRSVSALQELGVHVAIDNFGTGYSSLGLVRGFAVQAVKIDKSLVSSCVDKPECAAIMQAVGSMAHNLGLVVVAAGAETAEERYLIASLGCDRAQGLLIGEPVGWSEILSRTPVREARRSPSPSPQ